MVILGAAFAAYLIPRSSSFFLLFTFMRPCLVHGVCLFGQFPGAVYNAMSFCRLVSAMQFQKFSLLPVCSHESALPAVEVYLRYIYGLCCGPC